MGSDKALQRLWKAMDADRSGSVTVQEFMVFMRRRGPKPQLRNDHPRARTLSDNTHFLRRRSLTNDPVNMSTHISEEQVNQLCQALAGESSTTVAAAYAHWNKPFSGVVTELDWLKIVRELLCIFPAEIEDDAVHHAWCVADPDGVGEVALDNIFALQEKLRPTRFQHNSYEYFDGWYEYSQAVPAKVAETLEYL